MRSTFQLPLQMRFGDVDSYGHVNNVRFLQFLEDARVHWLREPLPAGAISGADPAANMIDFVADDHFTLVGRHEIEYLAPLMYRPTPIGVNLWVTRIGGSSFDLGYSVAERDGSAVYAYAATSMVLVSRSTGRPVRLPAELREAFADYSGPAVPFRRRPPLPADAPVQAAASGGAA
ncbi:thioesterase family protein [Sinomonas sp. JGH33]|uniref:Thioesterase family protein n=1 Tax=Sinomonas terricola TaxID=3110330 RepID=A0ABU5T6Z1_9MICC|nr:thioesterase family protein [Sinomonas sp. JGH33]MEA5455292.1 thioesterase family protein [Sinomonas sp. JGH33]